MKLSAPRVAAVHDLSCIGRCSLTVIMPVLSCMGVQVCPLPTAVLSTHLGGFAEVAFHEFTDHMPAFYSHWKRQNIDFDCIYSGFLASEQQIDVVSSFIDDFAANKPLILVDPVMGDHGKLYSMFTPKLQEQMKKLIQKADIITPNYTEACFLLGEPYREQEDDAAKLREWLVRLSEFGPESVVMTGVQTTEKVVTYGYNRQANSFVEVANQLIPARFPGTGDIFASVLAGAMLTGKPLDQAIKQAVDFVYLCIDATYKAGTPAREGVLLESLLPRLWTI